MLQFSPNSIRWMNWFLGVCHKQKILPTFKLFHTIFRVQRSTLHPMFELHFAGERLGFGKGSTKPVVNLTSLKGWHQEFIFIKGGDLAFTPIFSKTISIRSPEVPALEGPALMRVQNFCKGLGDGLQLTRDSLMKNGILLGLGCKFRFLYNFSLCCLCLFHRPLLFFFMTNVVVFVFLVQALIVWIRSSKTW